MDFWQRARTFAEDAAKRSQEMAEEAAKRSQDFTVGSSKLSDIVSEASKRSKEMASEASKKADLIKVEALKRADQIKSQIPSTSAALSQLVINSSAPSQAGGTLMEDLEKFGVTDDLREFVKHITSNTFRDFPMEDDSETSNIPTVSNVRQDLTKWQEIHAKIVLSTVKEISKLRYELCPRVMRERKFWSIYFILVNSHVASYEKRYVEEEKQNSLKVLEKVKEDVPEGMPATETVSKTEVNGDQKSRSAASKTADQDLDVFLLGDIGDSDDRPDDDDEVLDDEDDFDKL